MLTKREEKFLATYEEGLLGPKGKFIALYGLSWAAIVIVFTIAASIIFGEEEQFFWKSGRSAIIFFAVWVLGGLAYGWLMRGVLWKQYKKIKDKQAGKMRDAEWPQ